MIVLEARSLKKAYGSNRVLDDLSVSFEGGKLYALLGHNGAGKSTLMRVLMRKEGPDSGTGVTLGRPFDSGDPTLNSEIAYVSEETQFELAIPISELSSLFAQFYPKWNSKKFEVLVSEFGLPLDARPLGISRGQKMQLAFCVAMAIEPKIILVDEITSVMDAGARLIALRELVKMRDDGGTVVVATNIVTDIQAFADEVLLIQKGKIIQRGTPSGLAERFFKFRISATNLGKMSLPKSVRMVGANSDRSFSYIIPKNEVGDLSSLPLDKDLRETTTEEIFIFYTRSEP